MIEFPNGHKYKLVYIDTNIINAISKNTSKFAKIFFETYVNGEYAFVLSVFNLYELSRTQGESKTKIIEMFQLIPLAVMETYPRLSGFEQNSNGFSNDMILFTLGPKELGFKTQICMLFNRMEQDKSFEKILIQMKANYEKEIQLWRSKQTTQAWMKDFNKNLLLSMNESFGLRDNSYEINELGKYKSIEIFAFIKNQFIFTSKKEINQNSIIDAYNSAVAPYVDIYITEKTVGAWLEMAKDKFEYLSKLQVIKMSDMFADK